MAWKKLADMDLQGRRVLTRVDINVPVADGEVTDATRITRIVPTIRAIIAGGGKPILLAHFGRPKGKVVPSMSLDVVVPALQDALDAQVAFTPDCIGDAVGSAISELGDGEVLLLENTRFHPGEEANDPEFARALAMNGDVYCNDAFSAAHRAHASTEGLAHILPSCAGLLMEAELEALERALGHPERPVTAIVGGAKVSTKLDLLGNLIAKVDNLVIGGGMANTFLAAQGANVGKSLCEHDLADIARDILSKAADTGCEIILPVDLVVARSLERDIATEIVAANACPSDMMILDAGPASIARIAATLSESQTLVWNGPLGAFEVPPFNAATDVVAKHAANLTRTNGLVSIGGGGDTVAALNASGAANSFTYVSTAGGAFLEWLEGRALPGVEALEAV